MASPFTYRVSQIISTPSSVFLSLAFFLAHPEVGEHYPASATLTASPFGTEDLLPQLPEVLAALRPHLSALCHNCRNWWNAAAFAYSLSVTFSPFHLQCHKWCPTHSVCSVIICRMNLYRFTFILLK